MLLESGPCYTEIVFIFSILSLQIKLWGGQCKHNLIKGCGDPPSIEFFIFAPWEVALHFLVHTLGPFIFCFNIECKHFLTDNKRKRNSVKITKLLCIFRTQCIGFCFSCFGMCLPPPPPPPPPFAGVHTPTHFNIESYINFCVCTSTSYKRRKLSLNFIWNRWKKFVPIAVVDGKITCRNRVYIRPIFPSTVEPTQS